MRKLYPAIASGMLLATASMADVSIMFTNSLGQVGNSAETRPGSITLDFNVDAGGNVTLTNTACLTANATTEAALALWEGPVGTVDAAFGPATFSMTLTATGDKKLVLGSWNNSTGGFGITGENQWRIDDAGTDALVASVSGLPFPVGFKVTGLNWINANANGGTGVQLESAAGIATQTITSATDSASLELLAANSVSFGNATTNGGYTLQGFTFELADAESVYPAALSSTFDAQPGTSAITNVFTISADGSPTTASISGNSMQTDGLLAGATGSFGWTWEPVDQFDSSVVTGRVGTGWAYDGNQDAYGPKTIQSGNIGMAAGDAIIMTISTNDLVLPENKFLRVDNLFIRSDVGSHVVYFYDASEGTSTAITGPDSNNTTAQGNGVYQQLFQIVEDGDKIAFAQESGGQVRQLGFQFSVAEIKEDTDVPANVVATGLDTAVMLEWDDDASGVPLETYSVYRSLSSGVSTNDLFTNLTSSAFLDLSVVNDTEYFYAVSSTGTNGNESALSVEVSATPVAASTNLVLIQHLDASDAGTVATNGAGEMTLWADKTANGNDAVPGEGDPVLWPSASLSGTGQSGMDVRSTRATISAFSAEDTASFLDFSGEAAFNSGFTVLVAFKADFIFDDPNDGNKRNVVMGTQENLGSGNGFGLRYDRGVMTAFLNSSGVNTAVAKNGPSDLEVLAGDTIVWAFSYKASDGAMSFWDSKSGDVATGTAAPYGNFTFEELFLAGSGNGGQFMDGMIGEVQVYSTSMTEAELISRGENMSLFWGAVEGSGFDIWASLWGVDIGGETEDFDTDNVPNLLEYALNGNPTNGFDDTEAVLVNDGGLSYVHANVSADESLVYSIETRDDLVFGVWSNVGYTVISGTNVTGGTYDYVTNSVPTTDAKKFLRISVEKN